jgi:hypothetical protein
MNRDIKKISRTYRLSNQSISKISELSELLGIDATTTVEQAIAFYYEPAKELGLNRLRQRLKDLKVSDL